MTQISKKGFVASTTNGFTSTEIRLVLPHIVNCAECLLEVAQRRFTAQMIAELKGVDAAKNKPSGIRGTETSQKIIAINEN